MFIIIRIWVQIQENNLCRNLPIIVCFWVLTWGERQVNVLLLRVFWKKYNKKTLKYTHNSQTHTYEQNADINSGHKNSNDSKDQRNTHTDIPKDRHTYIPKDRHTDIPKDRHIDIPKDRHTKG